MSEKFKAFITKYAMTQGILEREVEVCAEVSTQMVKGTGVFECYHGEGRDWHRTREGAVARAEEMRRKKIASLKNTIKKLEATKF